MGHCLQVWAHNLSQSDPKKDAFARSAYNRYYFACYLSVRTELRKMGNIGGRKPNHSDIPEILAKKVSRKLQPHLAKARKRDDKQIIRQIEHAKDALNRAASIMETAYPTRLVADYEEESIVKFEGRKRFSLNGVNVTVAHDWYEEVRGCMRTVRAAWAQIDA